MFRVERRCWSAASTRPSRSLQRDDGFSEFDKKGTRGQPILCQLTKDALKDYFSEPRRLQSKTMVLMKNAVTDDTEHVTTGYRSDRTVRALCLRRRLIVETTPHQNRTEFLASTGQ
jgi:hypothetical protein